MSFADFADVAVTELDLPDGHGVDLIRDLRKLRPARPVLILTATADRYDLAQAVAAGAAGVLQKARRWPRSSPRCDVCAGQPVVDPAELVRLLRLAEQHRTEAEAAQAALARLLGEQGARSSRPGSESSDKEIAQLRRSPDGSPTDAIFCASLESNHASKLLFFAVKHGIVRLGV